ncbi:hypothetical protein BCR39DRAFT_541242 [Naematelia encephala]|uniref:Uncharacterized protein n=1 Tax=Naematelia encephala TaxID=71784 RepID=A0A1Y2AUN2_9TREE|nr:hypothetical protein BCR39DRAFT_541242 [Naematelia encephala]
MLSFQFALDNMFKKALAHQSNATPIRSSARRQLLTSIYEQYPSFRPGGEDAVPDKELGKIILPEGVRCGSFETSGGVEGALYLSPDGDPLWMSFGRNSKELVPTLCLLSLDLPRPPLPILQIHYPLPPPLLAGAPLFIPAVKNLSDPTLLPDVPEGAVVAFVTSERNDQNVRYVGVGRLVAPGGLRGAVDRHVRNLQEGKDVDEGRFCEVLCIEGDHLWEMAPASLRTFPRPGLLDPIVPPQAESPEAGPSRPPTPVPAIEQLDVFDRPDPLSPSETSTILRLALLQTLSSFSPSYFPMPASLFYSSCILPNRPAYIPNEQRDDAVIGKSEWKKLAKWMKEASKEGLIKIKESKSEIIVQGYQAEHPSVRDHVPFVTIADEEAKAKKRAAREVAEHEQDLQTLSFGKGKGREMEIIEWWKPNDPFWEIAGLDRNSLYPATHLKSAFEDYIAKHNLIDPHNHRIIRLDDDLGRAIGIKRPDAGLTITRDEAFGKLRQGVTRSVSVDGVQRKGALEPIALTVKTRQGRRVVTHVTGVEAFGINADELADELKRLCAGSASVQPLAGASPKLQLQEILVQGSQVKVITEALLGRGVPKKWIKEGEGSAGKKK